MSLNKNGCGAERYFVLRNKRGIYNQRGLIMSLNKDEYGIVIFTDMGEDVSTNIGVEMVLEPQIGDILTKVATDGVTVGSSNVEDGDRTLLANTYLQYTLKEGDLTFAGNWRKKGKVEIDSTKELVGNYELFEVLD